MDNQKRKSIASAIPVCTVLILTGTVVAFLVPEVSAFFVYDRTAVLSGELWRLLSSHMVHFGKTHFFYDLVAFGVVGWMVESKACRCYWLFCTVTALGVGLYLAIAKPQIHYYGGLSAIACGSLAYLALHGLHSSGAWRILCRLVLIILPIKIGLEGYTGGSVLPYSGPLPFVLIWESHALASLLALFCFLIQRFLENKFAHLKSNQFGFSLKA